MMKFSSQSLKETQILAAKLAEALVQHRQSTCIALNGTLGVGKTAFTKSLARGLGITEEVVSPSFAILQDYEGAVPLLHSDFYRLEEKDLLHLGLEEQVEDFDGIVVIEWAEKFPEILPLEYLEIQISLEGDCRFWMITAHGASLLSLLEEWKKLVEELL
jgi:tRNA threonylcarbamoyladenosine biosynthesis protein TsaE